MNGPEKKSLSYADAGVDIERADRLIDRIKPLAAKTRRPEVLSPIGGFGALFELSSGRYRNPVLVSGTDGVGTKLRLAIETGVHDTIGVDLVAMCANDILVLGAEPLFFLDYFATGHLDVNVAEAVVAGIARGCELAGAALVGGETAEMPGMYADDDYDLAGFCVGVVERDAVIDGTGVGAGDVLVGLGSSGPHSNGFSLVRKVLEVSGTPLDTPLEGRPLSSWLLEPTRIYVRSVLSLLDKTPIHAIAHITGGGLLDNLPRVLPDGTRARIDQASWRWPAVFEWLRDRGGIEDREMYRTFNCGVGMVLCVPAEHAQATVDALAGSGEQAWVLGRIEAGTGERVLFD